MTFKQIFQKDGKYHSESFREGVCFKIENGTIYLLEYHTSEDFLPKMSNYSVNVRDFDRVYAPLTNTGQLFNK